MPTKIEWANETWNPIRGCSKVSEGCRNCYAEKMAARFSGEGMPYEGTITNGRWNGQIKLVPEVLDQPLHWKRPRRIFVNSMSDLFHENVPFDFIRSVFEVMAEANWHTFQILTKRPERMKKVLDQLEWRFDGLVFNGSQVTWPLPNVWLGVSVESQKAADERIPLLLQTPAAVRFLSMEPLLGPVNLTNYLPYQYQMTDEWGTFTDTYQQIGVDWIIVGGESGRNARPMHPDWVRSLRDQCQAAGVAFFFKQWGEWAPYGESEKLPKRLELLPDNDTPLANEESFDYTVVGRVGKKLAGRLLDGREWNEYPGGERDESRT